MYDPFAPPQLPQQGQMQTMGAPQTVGMVPGVPGSMGTNPGGAIMSPGGGGTGAPVMAGGPSHNNALGGIMQSPQFQALLQAYPQISHYLPQGGQMGGRADWRSAMTDWRGARPDHQAYTGTDWQGTMQDWRSQRPGMQTPAMMPPVPAPAPAPVASGAPMDAIHTPRFAAPRAPRMSGPRGGAGNGYGF